MKFLTGQHSDSYFQNPCSENTMGPSNSVFSIPPKRAPSLPSPLVSIASPLKPVQMANADTTPNSLKTLLEVNKGTKPPESNSILNESSSVSLTYLMFKLLLQYTLK